MSKQKKILKIPFFSQWESAQLVEDIVKGKIWASSDPKWKNSGAESTEEYIYWSWNICGMACLKMILADKFDKEYKLIELAKSCESYGGYRRNGNKIEGLFYKPFSVFLKQDYGLKARVWGWFLTIGRIRKEIEKGNYVMASVNAHIRDLGKEPMFKGGHLVLVTGYDRESHVLYLHNPSGFWKQSQQNFEITENDFRKYFAGRGIVIDNS